MTISTSTHESQWLEAVDDARAILGVFEVDRPELNGSRLNALRVEIPQRFPTVTLGIILRDFPSNPPREYAGRNAIAIDLTIGNVSILELAGPVDENVGEFSLTRPEPSSRRLTFANDNVRLVVVGDVATVSGITAFVYDPESRC